MNCGSGLRHFWPTKGAKEFRASNSNDLPPAQDTAAVTADLQQQLTDREEGDDGGEVDEAADDDADGAPFQNPVSSVLSGRPVKVLLHLAHELDGSMARWKGDLQSR